MSRAKHKAKPERTADARVHAAGGVVRRSRRRGLRTRTEVALVHRPRYDDWTFPKGKRDGNETDEQTALREVAEETGFSCRLERDLGTVRYRDSLGRDKVVHYWAMGLAPGEHGDHFEPNREVDQLRWSAPGDAARLLTYHHDVVLLDRLRDA